MSSNKYDYNDRSVMPFGKHAGTMMENVPAHWLLWFYGQVEGMKEPPRMARDMDHQRWAVLDYIESNLEYLEDEVGKNY